MNAIASSTYITLGEILGHIIVLMAAIPNKFASKWGTGRVGAGVPPVLPPLAYCFDEADAFNFDNDDIYEFDD